MVCGVVMWLCCYLWFRLVCCLWVGLDVNSVGHDDFGGLRLLVVYSFASCGY